MLSQQLRQLLQGISAQLALEAQELHVAPCAHFAALQVGHQRALTRDASASWAAADSCPPSPPTPAMMSWRQPLQWWAPSASSYQFAPWPWWVAVAEVVVRLWQWRWWRQRLRVPGRVWEELGLEGLECRRSAEHGSLGGGLALGEGGKQGCALQERNLCGTRTPRRPLRRRWR